MRQPSVQPVARAWAGAAEARGPLPAVGAAAATVRGVRPVPGPDAAALREPSAAADPAHLLRGPAAIAGGHRFAATARRANVAESGGLTAARVPTATGATARTT